MQPLLLILLNLCGCDVKHTTNSMVFKSPMTKKKKDLPCALKIMKMTEPSTANNGWSKNNIISCGAIVTASADKRS